MTAIDRRSWVPPQRKQWPHIMQTWPRRVPDFRSYAHCHYATQVYIDNHDANPLRDLALEHYSPGVILLEWDIAFDGDDFRAICQRAGDRPDEGFVCPYKLWPGPTWGHRIMTRPARPDWWVTDGSETYRWATPADETCNLPCFGAIYIPRPILEAWEPPPHDPRLTDSNFALWAQAQGLEWTIIWDHRPVHLHW